jgi:hypothetical protein
MVITSACTPATNTPLTPTPTLTLITPTLLPTDTPLPTKTSVPTKTPIPPTATIQAPEQQPTATIQAPEQQLEQANKAFRDAVASEMQEAARQAGVKIRTDNFVAIPFDDSGTVVVNAMIEGADRVSIEQLAKGADVLFIYSGAKLEHAEERPKEEVDPGFYVVSISQDPASGQWIAQFKNLQGMVVLETEAIVEKPDSNVAKMQPMCTLGPKGELILFDEHDPFKNLTIKVASPKPCSSCGRARFVSESRTLREAAWQVVKEVTKKPISIEQVVPVSLAPNSIPHDGSPEPQNYTICVGYNSQGICNRWKSCWKNRYGDIKCILVVHDEDVGWYWFEIDITWVR